MGNICPVQSYGKNCVAFCINSFAHFFEVSTEMYISGQFATKDAEIALNSNRTLIPLPVCRKWTPNVGDICPVQSYGKNCNAFCINSFAHFFQVSKKCTSPSRMPPKTLKSHCYSTSGMSKMVAKRGQYKRSAILWEKLCRVLLK